MQSTTQFQLTPPAGQDLTKSEIVLDQQALLTALSAAGNDQKLREEIFGILRKAERLAADPLQFREKVRWPIIHALLSGGKTHRVTMKNGLVLEVSIDSRIEKSFLLSSDEHPDHGWEPQTTKLVLGLCKNAKNMIKAGAYFGDQIILLAAQSPATTIHAFEPMEQPYRRLVNNLKLNNITNVVTHQKSVWNESGLTLGVYGKWALARTLPLTSTGDCEQVQSITVDDYMKSQNISSVDLIHIDTEGGELEGVLGAEKAISLPKDKAPHLIFEIHKNIFDWTDGLANTSICKYLHAHGYTVFAIRDYFDNEPMEGHPIELVPIDTCYLGGPPHGFNLLATKRPEIVDELGMKIVPNVSPRLMLNRDPVLHAPAY